MAGNQNHGQIPVDRSRLRQQPQAIQPRELDVAHDDRGHIRKDARDRRFCVGERLDLKACEVERLLRAEQHRRVVFNQQHSDRI
jgi:hypothetical protein